MRGFPREVTGPLGPWYKKVNAAVDEAYAAKTAGKLLNILGDPDAVEDVPDDDRREEGATTIDPQHPDKIWIYVDPYRPRVRYLFGFSNGKIVERTRVTLAL